MTIEQRLTLWAAGSPKGEGGQLALEAAAEIERLKLREAQLVLVTLTDAEREAIAWVCFGKDGKETDTLRGLLERLGPATP